MKDDFYTSAKKVFDLDEGCKQSPYKDTKGYWTIGRGHFIGEDIRNLRLSLDMVDRLFFEDFGRCYREAALILGENFFLSLSPARKMAVITLLFTMGGPTVTEQFKETIEAIKAESWDDVANRVFTWKWAKDVDPKQVPGKGRDDRVAYMFRTGEFHPEYGVSV